jgi:hypothetical protein
MSPRELRAQCRFHNVLAFAFCKLRLHKTQARAVLLMPLACYHGALIGPRGTRRRFQKGMATMVTKECFNCKKVVSHEHFHDCAPGIPETHIAGSERFVCVLCGHITFAGSDGASRFPFTFDKVAAGR